jgi:hypothetical protein
MSITPIINFNAPSVFERKTIEIAIFKCLRVAGKCGGKVFGGYVRDVIVPLNNGNTPKNFKDVDIWFRSQGEADCFIDEMGSKITLGLNHYYQGNDNPYSFSRVQYNLIDSATNVILAWIDVIVSEKFPVNDFDVNNLTYQITSKQDVDYHSAIQKVYNGYDAATLIKSIRKKECKIMKSYIDVLLDNDKHKSHIARTRVTKRYIGRGWIVTVESPHTKLFGTITDIDIAMKNCEKSLRAAKFTKSLSRQCNSTTTLSSTAMQIKELLNILHKKADKYDILMSKLEDLTPLITQHSTLHEQLQFKGKVENLIVEMNNQ